MNNKINSVTFMYYLPLFVCALCLFLDCHKNIWLWDKFTKGLYHISGVVIFMQSSSTVIQMVCGLSNLMWFLHIFTNLAIIWVLKISSCQGVISWKVITGMCQCLHVIVSMWCFRGIGGCFVNILVEVTRGCKQSGFAKP